jgi:proline iminopeptidase
MKINITLTLLISFFIVQLSFAQDEESIFEKFIATYYKIDGYNINIETLGEGDPIIFIAGGPGNSHDYMQGNFGQYYKTNKVIFIDFLGRGLSDDAKNKSEYSVEGDVELLEEVRKILDLDKISIVGHSYGSVPAQAYAIKYPANVEKLVLINGFHSGEMWQANCDSYNHYAKTHFPELWGKVDSLRELGYVSSDSVFSKLYGSFPVKYVYYHNTKLNQNVPESKFRGMNIDVYYAIIGRDADFDVSGSMINQDYRRELKNITAPTLIIGGRYDGVSTPEYAVQYKKFMPQAKFVMFEQSAHNPYLEEPEKFYNLFEDFFGINHNK